MGLAKRISQGMSVGARLKQKWPRVKNPKGKNGKIGQTPLEIVLSARRSHPVKRRLTFFFDSQVGPIVVKQLGKVYAGMASAFFVDGIERGLFSEIHLNTFAFLPPNIKRIFLDAAGKGRDKSLLLKNLIVDRMKTSGKK